MNGLIFIGGMKFEKGDIITPPGAVRLTKILVIDRYDDLGCLWAHSLAGGPRYQYRFELGEDQYWRLLTDLWQGLREPQL